MSCRSTIGGTLATRLARAYSGLNDKTVQSLFHSLKREGSGLPEPDDLEIQAWLDRQRVLIKHAPGLGEKMRTRSEQDLFRAFSEDYDPATFYALQRIEVRSRQEAVLRSVKGYVVDLEPPGSQADYYQYDEDGRPSQVWYASYGSNLSRERFLTYISGGVPEGSTHYHKGCRDITEPDDDIPVRFAGRMHFAANSGRWGGGVAFMDNDHAGHALGRAYLINVKQFDDVVAQENGKETGTVTVDTDEVLINGHAKLDNSLYGTLVHIGDYRGAPVFTFTGDFTAREALESSLDPKTWIHGTNEPSPNYIRLIGGGLGETFGMDVGQQADYLRGSLGCENMTRTKITRILKTPPDRPVERKGSLFGTSSSSGSASSPQGRMHTDWDDGLSPGRLWSTDGTYTDVTEDTGSPWWNEDSRKPVSGASAYPKASGRASVNELRATFKAAEEEEEKAASRKFGTARRCPMCDKLGHKMQDCPQIAANKRGTKRKGKKSPEKRKKPSS